MAAERRENIIEKSNIKRIKRFERGKLIMSDKQILAILKSLIRHADETLLANDWEDIWVSQVIPWVETYNKLKKIAVSKNWLDDDMVEHDLVGEIDASEVSDEDGAALLFKVRWFSSLLSDIIDKTEKPNYGE